MQLAPEAWPGLKQQLLVALGGSTRSSKPSIFGMAAEADTSTFRYERALRSALLGTETVPPPLQGPVLTPQWRAFVPSLVRTMPVSGACLPCSALASAGDPDALEAAASDMAAAAAALVSVERAMLALGQDGADAALLAAKQVRLVPHVPADFPGS